MNMPADDQPEMRYAEYALGVLDADERAAVAHEVETSAEAAVAVDLWQRRLAPLADCIAQSEPGPSVWSRIDAALQLDAPDRSASPRNLWDNLSLWRWLGIGAGAVAIALALVLVLPRGTSRPPVAGGLDYMASTIRQTNGATGWTATMDLHRARMVIIPASPVALANGRAAELWLIPAGQKPIAVGIIARDQPTTIALDRALLARLGPTATLAVSVEPIGGSRTGAPTGPVIAKGAIGAARPGGQVAALWQHRDHRVV